MNIIWRRKWGFKWKWVKQRTVNRKEDFRGWDKREASERETKTEDAGLDDEDVGC